MNNNILLIGTHPVRENIISQYQVLGHSIVAFPDFASVDSSKTYHEVCILPNDIYDYDLMQDLEAWAINYPETPDGQSKPVCHLMLSDKVTLWLLQTLDLYPEIHKKFELYAFTMEDQWAKATPTWAPATST